MPDGVVILRVGDAPRLAALHATGFERPWSAKGWEEMLRQSTTLCLGVEASDDALSAAIAVQFAFDTAEILTLVTAPSARRTGLARHLVEAALTHAGERGISRMRLDVSESNHTARALYEGLAFKTDGRRTAYYSDGSDAILLSRELGV